MLAEITILKEKKNAHKKLKKPSSINDSNLLFKLNCIMYVLAYLSYLNFKAVLALPKMARFAQTHKSTYKFHLNCLEHSICISLGRVVKLAPGGRFFELTV